MFTPIETTIGALLIQSATTSYLLTVGATVGFSSVLGGLPQLNPQSIYICLGMALSLALTYNYLPDFIPEFSTDIPWHRFLISGLLVGFGTKFGSGCTSGHMINGLSRLRVRSVIATAIFVSTAILTNSYLQRGELCPQGHCYNYDRTFTNINNNASQLLWLLGLSMAISYCALPALTKMLTPQIAQLLNGINAGVFFGLGLVISGMAQPSKTLAFLSIMDPFKFDPSLALIVVFTIIPNIFIWNFYILKRGVSISGLKFNLLTNTKIPFKFVFGNILFGIGWGNLGICPGPGILSNFFAGTNGFIWTLGFLSAYRMATQLS